MAGNQNSRRAIRNCPSMPVDYTKNDAISWLTYRSALKASTEASRPSWSLNSAEDKFHFNHFGGQIDLPTKMNPIVDGMLIKCVKVSTREITFLRPLSNWGQFRPSSSSPSPRKALFQSPMASEVASTSPMSGSTQILDDRNAGPVVADDDTVLISQMSGQTTLTQGISQGSPRFRDPVISYEPRGHTTKKKPLAREVVDEDHLCTLVAAYNVHFEKYSEGRTQVTQLIPSIVWKATFASYKEAYPLSVFKQDSLKERLREVLKEIKTGNSNEENAEKVALQCNSVMETLRCTDGHAKRNVLRKRQKILQATTDNLHGPSEGSGETDPTGTPLPSSPLNGDGTPHTPVKLKKQSSTGKENVMMTKAQMLNKQSSSLEKLCKTFEKSTSKREALVEMKTSSSFEKQKKHRIANLKTALLNGVISDYDFKACALEKDPDQILFQDDYIRRAMQIFILPGEDEGLPVNWIALDDFIQPLKKTLMLSKNWN